MSRIDDALRRAGTSRSRASASITDPDTAFVSPWEFNDGDTAVATEPSPLEADPPAPTRQANREALDSTSAASGQLLTAGVRTEFRDDWKTRLVAPGSNPMLVEQFRRLAASLLHGQREGKLKTLMVTSAVAGEGKTLTAMNLALVLSESYRRRVLLVDADLRRPRISEAANLRVVDGLAEALKSADERRVPLIQLSEHLTLLPAGRPDPEPLSGLTSPRMQRLIEEASERFEWVIVDTPPIEAAADAGLLGAMVDAVVLVVRAEHTAHGAVQRAIDTVGRERIFGVVLNGVAESSIESYSAYPYSDSVRTEG